MMIDTAQLSLDGASARKIDTAKLKRLRQLLTVDRAREAEAGRKARQSLQQDARAARETLFPQKLRARIREAVTKATTRPAGSRPRARRYLSLKMAHEQGVDLKQLAALDRELSAAFGALTEAPPFLSTAETLVADFSDLEVFSDEVSDGNDPGANPLYSPPYLYPVERWAETYVSGASVMKHNAGYVNPLTSRVGSWFEAYNHDDDDFDFLGARRDAGYAVPFRCATTGPIEITADLTALICRHFIRTTDEWGWSKVDAETVEHLIAAVTWNLDDSEPASEVRHARFIPGLRATGDGESYPGTSVEALPGERRIIALTTDRAFQAGDFVYVYVGLLTHMDAFIDDVSIDFGINSAWHLNSIAVRSL